MLITANSIMAQTISNPDFELKTGCPTSHTQMNLATGWNQPTNGTSDYLNTCGYNFSDKIIPYSGTGYVGAFIESISLKEYITNTLSVPLVKDVTYTISFMVAHLYGSTNTNAFGGINFVDLPLSEQGFLGIMFSESAPTQANVTSNYGSPISDSFGSGKALIPVGHAAYSSSSRNQWVPVTLTYKAKGGERYMTVGQFRNGSTSSIVWPSAAYFLYDKFSSSLTPTPVCNAGTTPPPVKNVSNVCPATTVNLVSAHTGFIPAGASLVWYKNNTHTGPPLTTSEIANAGAGTYYAFYHDESNNCYGPVSNVVNVTITSCCNAGTDQVSLKGNVLINQ